jgi:hypothetical protein
VVGRSKEFVDSFVSIVEAQSAAYVVNDLDNKVLKYTRRTSVLPPEEVTSDPALLRDFCIQPRQAGMTKAFWDEFNDTRVQGCGGGSVVKEPMLCIPLH